MENFSPANWAEIPARRLKEILLKSNCRLHGEEFSLGCNSTRAENPSPVKPGKDFQPGLKKSHVIEK